MALWGSFVRLGLWLALLAAGFATPAQAAFDAGPDACVIVSDHAITFDQMRGSEAWDCQPRFNEIRAKYAWLRLGETSLPRGEAMVFRSDANAFDRLELTVEMADGTYRARIYDSRALASNWSVGTSFSVPLYGAKDAPVAVYARYDGLISHLPVSRAEITPQAIDQQEKLYGMALFAFFIGMAVIVFIYSLGLYAALRAPFALYHAVSVLFLTIYMLSSSSLLLMFWNGFELWDRTAISYTSLALSIMPLMPLFAEFIGKQNVTLWMRRLFLVTPVSLTIGIFAYLIGTSSDPYLAGVIYNASYLPALATFAIVCAATWKHDTRGARQLLLAWIVPAFVAIERVARGLELYSKPFEWDYAFYFAMGYEMMVMTGVITWRVAQIRRERDRALAQEGELTRLAETDELTGLPNRRAFEMRHWRKGDYLAIVDADHFKRINDQHGHHTGDEVLRAIGKELAELQKSGQVVAAWRLGGEEFAVLVQGSSSEHAALAVNHMRERVAAAVRTAVPTLKWRISVSAGLAKVGKAGIEAAYKSADNALYHAKSSGRDRLCYEIGEETIATIFPRRRAA